MICYKGIAGMAAFCTLLVAFSSARAEDSRLVLRHYDANKVVTLEGRAGVQATVMFEPNEHIENVAIGDSASWQVTPNKRANLVFVKPLAPRARTNMTVVTDKRSYFLDLIASPTSKAVYALRFTYDDQKRSAGSAFAALASDRTIEAGGRIDSSASRLNFAWGARGKAKLHPARIYDDGRSTYLSWASGTPLPAILVRNHQGDEGPVNFAVQGNVIVVDGVPNLIVLRSGKDVAMLENRARPAPGQAQPKSSRRSALASQRKFATPQNNRASSAATQER